MGGIYSINTPEKLFERLAKKHFAFNDHPTEDSLFDLLFPLYHLREWICPGGYESIKGKDINCLSEAESLYCALHDMPEYDVIRSLCNAAKHYNVTANTENSRVIKGSITGLLRAGDRLGRTYFLLDGVELRDYFCPVFKAYYQYFTKKDKQAT